MLLSRLSVHHGSKSFLIDRCIAPNSRTASRRLCIISDFQATYRHGCRYNRQLPAAQVATSILQYGIHRAYSSNIIASQSSRESPADVTTKSTTAVSRKRKSTIASYMELSKFRLSSLVVLTTAAGFVSAGVPLCGIETAYTMAGACFGTALCAASASTFNHIIEQHPDSNMNRTKQRPLPSGAVSRSSALAFGSAAGVSGVSLLLASTNPAVAALGALNIGLYAGAYTYSKRVTEWNTWIGAIVGAIPPVMGWGAAMGGSQLLAPEPLALASLLFLWQFPHFFALSWLHREDYARGGFQMVAVNDPTGQRSARLILEYSLYLTALPVITSAAGLTSYMFALEGTAANIYLLYLSKKFYDERTNAGAKRVFLCSLWYLPLLLTAFVFHSHMWQQQQLVISDELPLQQRLQGDDGQPQEQHADVIKDAVVEAKGYLKGLCLHEIIVQNEQTKSPQLCPKTQSNKVLESADKGVQAAAATITEAAGNADLQPRPQQQRSSRSSE